ncbi:MAG: Gfo/Idh/MocA family oxidoreductase [Planctomycetes bacterium]|nr:Gfo/Idh/MocA family oxidoreductase [Planctomycetota bacterium]
MSGRIVRKMSRRRFLGRTAAGGASVLALPSIVNSGVLNQDDVVRLCTVGCGGRGSRDLRAISAVPKAKIVGICELRDDRLKLAQQIASVHAPNPYKDFRVMLEREKPDGVTVVVEVQNHAKVVVPVLEMGYNCFSEKPMDTTVEKVDQMVETARRTKRWIQVGFQRRYIPGHQAMVQEIHEAKLGKVYALQGHWHFFHPQGPADADWDGGRLIEQACHHMDVMNWVMGNRNPLRCVSIGRPPTDRGNGSIEHLSEAGSATAFEFPENVIFSYTHLMGVPGTIGEDEGPSAKPDEQNFINEKLWVFCQEGAYDLTRGMRYLRDQAKTKERAAPASQGYDEGTEQELASFVDCLRTGRTPVSNHETARISTFMSFMGRKAMYDRESRMFNPEVVRWEDLGSRLAPA